MKGSSKQYPVLRESVDGVNR